MDCNCNRKRICHYDICKNYSLKEKVKCFQKKHKRIYCAEINFYTNSKNLKECIDKAALCKCLNGKQHPHQRAGENTLLKVKEQIEKINILKFKDFHSLFLEVEKNIKPIYGIGDLTIYDVSHRIGLYLNIKPKYVYLHSGAKIGAKNLGIKYKRWIKKKDLPKELHVLEAGQIEDFLCICKESLKAN